MKLNRKNVKKALKTFRFEDLFIEELGWDIVNQSPINIVVSENSYTLEAIAQKRGMIAYHCIPNNGQLPDHTNRRKIDKEITQYTREHFIIYGDKSEQLQIWQWIRREPGKPQASREFRYYTDKSGEALIQKLETIAVDIYEEEKLTLVDVTRKTRKAFDVNKVTNKFFEDFKKEHATFLNLIKGITSKFDQEWYTSLILNRLMFIYFMQKKGFLDGDINYLRNRLEECKNTKGQDEFYSFYRYFLLRLFHDGLGSQDRTDELEKLLGRVPYLNGGLFEVHQIEQNYPDIQISDVAFEKIFNFFDQYNWHLDDRPLRSDNEVNPDVLGYIFEKYINNKQMGAYYTKEDITGYISKNCIIPYLFDAAKQAYPDAFSANSPVWKLLSDDPNRYIYESVQKGVDLDLPDAIAVGINDVSQRTRWNEPATDDYALPTEIWREHISRRQRCLEIRQKLNNAEVTEINDLITYNLDIRQFAQDAITNSEDPKLIWVFYETLEKMSVLDPSCGSGAFLFAALNILDTLYDGCLERMQSFLEDGQADKYERQFQEILERVEHHQNRRYFILKSIMINNLYGVDIMEEATEICKLRLFLKLASQVEPDEDKENWGIEPLPDIDFNIRAGNTLVGFASYEGVKKAVEGEKQMKLDLFSDMDRIDQKAQAVDKTFQEFRNLQTQKNTDGEVIAVKKKALTDNLEELRGELDQYLADECERGQSKNTQKFKKWKESHQPFHWFVEFYRIIKNGGFDTIIGNPPYVEYSKVKKDYQIKDYETEKCGNLYAFMIERSLQLTGNQSYFSMIIPISMVGNKRFKDVRKMLLNKGINWVSFFSGDTHPGTLFSGVQQNLCILINKISVNKQLFTSDFIRFFDSDNDRLFLFEVKLNYFKSLLL